MPAPLGSSTASTGCAADSYNVDTTKASDEAGNQRTSIVDGAGRLIQVTEAHGVANFCYNTQYSYDALDNLATVQQGSLPNRQFSYSSLSRLVSSTNLETGPTTPITYLYDANGNLLSRQDARVTTTYDPYDALNRATRKHYSDGTTTDVRYCYDGASSRFLSPPSHLPRV